MATMRQRILVVDDDTSLSEMLTIVLRNEGFETAVIADGSQALTAVRELRPDQAQTRPVSPQVQKSKRQWQRLFLQPF
jgi:CheY-like chemotaxis protein